MKCRQKFKRIIAFILCVTIGITAVPQVAYAMPGNKLSDTVKEYTYDNVKCKYTEVSSWGNSVNAEIVIENNSDEPIYNWSVSFDYDGIIDNIWNADVKVNNDGSMVIKAKDYNSVIRPNSSASFGMIAHGEAKKPDMPENIDIFDENGLLFSDRENNTEETTEETTEDNTDIASNTEADKNDAAMENDNVEINFPDRLKALNYAVLTTDNSSFNVSANMLKVKGDVHSNNAFAYSGTSIDILGKLEASKNITLNTSSGKDCQKISQKVENAQKVDMPNMLEEVYNYAKENGEYSKDYISHNANDIAIAKPIVTDSGASINGTTFLDKGILYAKDSISYNVNSFATPTGSRVLIVSENGNINISGTDVNINAVLYAPNGTVNINVNSLNLNGRIIAKQIYMNGTSLNINAGPYDYDMIKFLYAEELDLKASGNLKENRKVSLDLLENNFENCTTKWNIEKNDCSDSASLYAFDDSVSTATHRELIFKEAGTYTVTVKVKTNNEESQVTKEIVIDKDIEPEAAFDMPNNYFYRENGEVNFNLEDKSASLDNDELVTRRWYIFYDANNNGKFEDSEKKLLNDSNKTNPNVAVSNVGKYKIELEVIEGFDDTIPSLIDESAFKKAVAIDTFEVGNKKPTATVSIEKAKKADLVFTVGDCTSEELDIYNQRAEAIKATLDANGVDARIETVSTKALTAQDTFAWKEFSHTDYGYNHIQITENGIKMIGNKKSPVRDFLYVECDDPGKKVFTFDLQRDKTDWHSMEGGGFLFNTRVDEDNNTINGFCVLTTNDGFKLVQINCKNLNGFRNSSYSYTQNAGKLLISTPKLSNIYDMHHIKIVVDKNTVSVWDGDELKIDNFVLPENDYGYGYGPITAHRSHNCSQLSYFTFDNIRMETMTGTSLSDIVSGYDWRSDAERYVFNLSNTVVPELISDEDLADTAAALLKTDTKFIGLGNDTNENQYRSLINAIDGKGMYQPKDDISSNMSEIEDMILKAINAKDYSINDMITKDITVEYNSIFADEDGDELLDQEWEYEYDPSIFNNILAGERKFIRSGNEPVKQFDETGAYTIRLKVRDNPFANKKEEKVDNDKEDNIASDTDAKPEISGEAGNKTDVSNNNEQDNNRDEYCLWSDTAESEKLLIVQSRPVAELKVDVTNSPSDKNKCNINVTYNSYDDDHKNDKNKGIREEYFSYKKLNDAEWTEGKIPNVIAIGDTYLVRYQVKDSEGTLSFPAISVVKSNDYRKYEEIVDENPPSVYITAEKYEVNVGEQIIIEGFAEDDYGVDIFEMYVDGKQVLDCTGRYIFTGSKEGIVTVKATAIDIGGNKAEDEIAIKVVDKTDKIPPIAIITSPSSQSDINFGVVEIIGTAKDETEFDEYTLGYKEESEEEYHIFATGKNVVDNDKLGEIDISKLKQGKYSILLTAKDKRGNKAFYGINLFLETGNSTYKYEIVSELTDVYLDDNDQDIKIKGTASADGYFGKYILTLRYEDEEETVIAEGTEEKFDELLASIPTEKMETGSYHLTLKVTDNTGEEVDVTGTFKYTKGSSGATIKSDTYPPVAKINEVAITDNKAYINVTATVNDDKLLRDWKLEFVPVEMEQNGYEEIASGTDAIENQIIASISTEDLADGEYKLKLTAYDEYENGCISTAVFKYIKGQSLNTEANKTEPETNNDKDRDFVVNISKNKAKIGETIQVSVTLPEGANEADLEIYIGDKLLEQGKKTTSFVTENLGENVIIAKLGDREVKAVCFVYDDKDKNPPKVFIDKPFEDEVLTKPTDIIGSAYDAEELLSYKLEYRLDGASDDDFVLLAKGDNDVRKDVLATFDTTTLENGRYEIRLTATDKGGNSVYTVRYVIVEGELKIGNMDIGFTDISNTLSGINIDVNRLYSSNNKNISGDFGYGWKLDLLGLKVYETGDITSGYELGQSGSLFSTTYKILETSKHELVINYGNGSSDRFKLTFSPESSVLVPIIETSLGYKCVTNPKLKLEFVDDTTAYVTGYELFFYNEDIYEKDGRNYVLTTENKDKIYINAVSGVYKIESKNGNVVVVDKNGYHSQDGNSIILERDSKNRIIEATDKFGREIKYTYDKDGNLSSVMTYDGKVVSYTYDSKHNLISIIDPSGIAVARNEYDENGRLIATIDAEGNRTEYDHDIEGRLEVVRDKMGNATTYVYDDNGNVLKQIDALGNVYENEFDSNNNLTKKVDALGNVTTFKYDSNGNLLNKVNGNGEITEVSYKNGNITKITMDGIITATMLYDDYNNITSIVDSDNNETNYTYNNSGNIESISDSLGTITTYKYDSNNNVLESKDGNGNVTKYVRNEDGKCTQVSKTNIIDGKEVTLECFMTYDAEGNIIHEVDSMGNEQHITYNSLGKVNSMRNSIGMETKFEYDDCGNIIKIIYPNESVETFEYDANGNVISTVNLDGIKSSMTYDKLNRLVKKESDNGVVENYTYDAVGNVTEKTINGNKTSYEYDALRRNTAIIDSYGNKTSFEYDNRSNLTKKIDANGNIWSYTYDARNNQTSVVKPNGAEEKAVYDGRSRLIEKYDAEGNKTSYLYDNADRMIKSEDALGNSTEYKYDNIGNLIEIKDANGNIYSFEYDKLSQLIKKTNGLGYSCTYEYDALGNVVKYVDYAGHVTVNEYDCNNRIVKKSINGNEIIYSYVDESGKDIGRIVSEKNNEGTIKYKYDRFGRIISKTDTNNIELKYSYTNNGKLSKIVSPYSETSYDYDEMDRIVRVVDHNGNATVYTYDNLGNRATLTYANGVQMKYTYDVNSALISIDTIDSKNNVIKKYVYTRNKNGYPIEIEETSPSETIKTSYQYDSLNRLISEKIEDNNGSISYTYGYDAVSNRTFKETKISGNIEALVDSKDKISDSKITYTYNENNQLVIADVNGVKVQYNYDTNGNLINIVNEGQVQEFEYNDINKLSKYTNEAGVVYTYTYDAEGNRIGKHTDGKTTKFVVSDFNNLEYVLLELDEKDKLTKYYTIGEDVISLNNADIDYFYIIDGHGSVSAVTDINGKVVNSYYYDSYGVSLRSNENVENSLLYNCEQYDEESGLYYLRARYMNPNTGTFTQEDTYQGDIYDSVSLHKYLYAGANPVAYDDASGNMFSLISISISSVMNKVYDSVEYLGLIKLYMNLKKTVTIAYNGFNIAMQMLTMGDVDNTKELIEKVYSIANSAIAILGEILGIKVPKIIQNLMNTYSIAISDISAIITAFKEGNILAVLVAILGLILDVFGVLEDYEPVRGDTGNCLDYIEDTVRSGTISKKDIARFREWGLKNRCLDIVDKIINSVDLSSIV